MFLGMDDPTIVDDWIDSIMKLLNGMNCLKNWKVSLVTLMLVGEMAM